jgi:deoxyxylulose-5-phosphate synthase
MRKQFADFIKLKLKEREHLSVLLGDISVGLFLDDNESLPSRVYNVGILEQSMVSMAAGMSSRGYEVFVHTISPFIIERAFEQIKLDIAYNKNKVILVSANGPGDYNKLGPTHHCFSDVPLLRLVPGLQIYMPGRTEDVARSLEAAMADTSPAYVRLTSRVSAISAVPGSVNVEGRVKSDSLNIFIGEALHHFELNQELHKNDWIYTYKFDEIGLELLEQYEEIVFWEPYSSPIAGPYYRQRLLKSTKISSMIYPLSIELGIFDTPNYTCVVI